MSLQGKQGLNSCWDELITWNKVHFVFWLSLNKSMQLELENRDKVDK